MDSLMKKYLDYFQKPDVVEGVRDLLSQIRGGRVVRWFAEPGDCTKYSLVIAPDGDPFTLRPMYNGETQEYGPHIVEDNLHSPYAQKAWTIYSEMPSAQGNHWRLSDPGGFEDPEISPTQMMSALGVDNFCTQMVMGIMLTMLMQGYRDDSSLQIEKDPESLTMVDWPSRLERYIETYSTSPTPERIH